MPRDDEKLLLRPFTIEDEAEARLAQVELAKDDFTFLLEYLDGEPWPGYLARVESHRLGRHLPDGHVASTFLAADVAGQLVGRVSIRHELNDFLLRFGGHIGYGIRPAFRRRGYATAVLRQALQHTADLGIERVLVTCDEGNLGSATVIETCGGVFENIAPQEGQSPKRRYWITPIASGGRQTDRTALAGD